MVKKDTCRRMNPGDLQRRKEKAKLLEKNKIERQKCRTMAKIRADPEGVLEEYQRLERKVAGRKLDANDKRRWTELKDMGQFIQKCIDGKDIEVNIDDSKGHKRESEIASIAAHMREQKRAAVAGLIESKPSMAPIDDTIVDDDSYSYYSDSSDPSTPSDPPPDVQMPQIAHHGFMMPPNGFPMPMPGQMPGQMPGLIPGQIPDPMNPMNPMNFVPYPGMMMYPMHSMNGHMPMGMHMGLNTGPMGNIVAPAWGNTEVKTGNEAPDPSIRVPDHIPEVPQPSQTTTDRDTSPNIFIPIAAKLRMQENSKRDIRIMEISNVSSETAKEQIESLYRPKIDHKLLNTGADDTYEKSYNNKTNKEINNIDVTNGDIDINNKEIINSDDGDVVAPLSSLKLNKLRKT